MTRDEQLLAQLHETCEHLAAARADVERLTAELARSGAEVERLKARIQASDRHGAEGWKMAQTLGEGFQRKAFWSAGRKRALRRGSISAANLSVLRTEHAKRVASDAEVERLRGVINDGIARCSAERCLGKSKHPCLACTALRNGLRHTVSDAARLAAADSDPNWGMPGLAAVPAEAPAKPCSDETGQTPSITKPGTCARCGAVLGQYSICDECPAEADTTEECMTCDGKGRDCGETCIGCAGSGRRCSGCLNASAYCSCDDPDPAAPPTTTKDGNK